METTRHRSLPHLRQHTMIGKRLERATAGGEQPFTRQIGKQETGLAIIDGIP
jgi:hypothetical protein